MTILAIIGAGALGSALRYLSESLVPARLRSRFPWGTWLVNIAGSFLLGLLAGGIGDPFWSVVLGTGLLGGYTTFSAASLQVIELAQQRRYAAACSHATGMLLAAVLAATAGLVLGGIVAGGSTG
ncbi:fluoride efflux transporter FluC [Sediminivirga luteola]|jgi:CrcB protein|uniref:Fluoride-specific ion channel FluC n=1 Tax=Sediminivirga luteola TaxID=1774748 RepID=A0A8J2TZA5_9MICO|nr:CrcB family protein [Sediminivirga luteola]MCI2266722.1 CrcB family protein [Sediminivirga luteola]GGA18926.1 putative fluoride ion transporter CrcB [Sediminivirga luteola]